ncbi:hypothetical protein JH25_27870 [Pseudomonas sp. BRG-100]|uniref:hypothetical protein n=1 Tax=Pseudomonas sp. BRG-100 TaxID=1524267 RepID=UPI0004E7584A|nr:hypothetical protein [Pseudomonas sp. BRG-100]KFF42187.1 hypothetical protein JH25_27870 [Pseudomonas sp. BRG-100]
MCEKDCRCYHNSEEYKAYKVIEDQIGQSTPDQAWALYFVSEGVVRENITTAVMTHIANGNEALASAFPELAHLYKPHLVD